MPRRFLCGFVAALVLAPVAAADGGGISPGVIQGGQGVSLPGLGVRYDAVSDNKTTFIEAIRKSDGQIRSAATVSGNWGIPLIGLDGSTGGLSKDGSTLVLGEASPLLGPNGSRTRSSFLVYDTRHSFERARFTLRGDFAYDALSPDGLTLYLIQHVSTSDLSRYVVRAYDLATDRLLPGRIADRTQRGWVMTGYAVTRATSVDGRWVYTLYRNDGGYPFVHALDTVNRKAHCIGVPWTGSQDNLSFLRLSLRDSGRRLDIHWRDGTLVASIDSQTFRLLRPTDPSGGSFPWWAIVLPAAVLVLAVFVSVVVRRQKATEVLPT
jgi:hypothetical protein